MALALCGAGAFAREANTESKPSVALHGFIRNFYAYDTRECVAGTEDFFLYLPKDVDKKGDFDLNDQSSFRTAALTSRFWIEAKGYEYEGVKMGARIEADFYSGLSGVSGTATLRLRQAFVTLDKNRWNLKLGQAWHPLAADFPDVFSLNAGSPFNPFSRSPLIEFNYKAGAGFSLTGTLLWQMQYNSTGPAGKSANYIKYAKTPELYVGLNYSKGGFLTRAGVDVLSIKPRWHDGAKKVSDRITTFSPFVYVQYRHGLLSFKLKSVFAEAGEHLNLNGGYGIHEKLADGSYTYTPSRNSSTWFNIAYGSKLQAVFFAGYCKNFGTKDTLLEDSAHPGFSRSLYFGSTSFSNMNMMWRVQPAVVYNLGKLALGLEFDVTSVQYGEYKNDTEKYVRASNGLVTDNLHWVTNKRVQALIKYTF